MINCLFCKSKNVMRYGIRYNKRGNVQIYKCRECGRRFTPNDGFLHSKCNKEIVTLSLDLYFKGLSLRKIQHHLKQFYNIKVCHTTILYWVRKYSQMINNYSNRMKLKSVNSFGADETGLYFRRHLNWLWGIVDNDSRFLIALQLTRFRYVPKYDVFQESRKIVKGNPKMIITDGFPGYKKIVNASYPESEHISLRGISDRGMNNTTERMWSNLKERYKIMRGFKSINGGSIILDGWRSYYNFIRPHMGLDGRTPAEAAGLNINLEGNKWLGLIQRSAGNAK